MGSHNKLCIRKDRAQVRDNFLLPLGMQMQLNLINQQDTRGFQRILPVGVHLRQATSKIQDHGQQVAVAIAQLLKLKDLRRPMGGSERHFETRRAVIEEDALNMLQGFTERLAYSPKIGKLEGLVVLY